MGAPARFEATPSSNVVHPLPGTSRYELVAKIASGGMAMVYVGRLRGAAGFWRLCAIKRAHPHLVEDPELRKSLVDEARLASRIHHPNVVAVSDVEELDGELLLVMDYVEGASLSDLLRLAEQEHRTLSPRAVVRIGLDAAAGLGAAHALCDDHGAPLGLVHRDVSPQNVLVGADGVARIVDFGIAKCRDVGVSARTTTGALKGKVAYMSPEYVRGRGIDARSDVFGLGVVLWEAFTGARLFRADTELETMTRVTSAPAPLVSSLAPDLAPLDAVLARALEKSPARRFSGMQELASTLVEAAAAAGLVGAAAEVSAEVQALAGEALEQRRVLVRARMQAATTGVPPPPESMRLVPGAVESSSGEIVDPSDVAPTVQRLAPGSAGAPAGEPPRTDAFVLRARERPSRSHRVVWVAVGAAAVAAGVAAFLSFGGTPPDAPASAETASGAVVGAPPSRHDEATSKAAEPAATPPTAAAAEPSASVATPPASATSAPARPTLRPQTRGPRPRPGSKDTPDPNPYSP